ncbi:MAG: hypothetical protein QXP77_01370 [Candidatus Aenigmatarchaeota archaeon]
MKGIMFSVITIVLAGAILVGVIYHSVLISSHRERLLVEIRTSEMYNLYKSVLRDFDKAIDVIAPRAISSAIGYVVTNGIGLDEADKRLEELIMNGTLYGVQEPLLEDTTLPEWARGVEALSFQRGFILDIDINSYEIRPFDSWNLVLEANLTINITEKDGVASLIKNVTKVKLIPIIGFEDPIYPLKTLGRATSVIVRSPFYQNFTQNLASGNNGNNYFYGESIILPKDSISSFPINKSKILIIDDVSGIKPSVEQKFGAVVCECSETFSIPFVSSVENAMQILPNNTKLLVDGDNKKIWFIENLKEHLKNSYYIPSEKGASFLDRLEGKLEVQDKYKQKSDRIIGIESLVNKYYLRTLDLAIDSEKSNVDHLYFSEDSHQGSAVKGFYLEGFGYELRIDSEACGNLNHTEIYGVHELT